MKRLLLLLLAAANTVPLAAQQSRTNAPPPTVAPGTNQLTNPASALVFQASNGVVIAPLLLTNGYLTQLGERTDGTDGGWVVFPFTLTNAGEYVIYGTVRATDEESNSFFLNIDEVPEDPTMIWDIVVTDKFEEQVVNWRGTGASGSDEFDPKVFTLAAGRHRLIIYGREPNAQLMSLSIQPHRPAAAK